MGPEALSDASLLLREEVSAAAAVDVSQAENPCAVPSGRARGNEGPDIVTTDLEGVCG